MADTPSPGGSNGIPAMATADPPADAPLEPPGEAMAPSVLAPAGPVPTENNGAGEPTAPASPASPPPSGTPVEVHGQLHVDGTQLVDERGAVVQLKGVSTMWLNWETRYSASKGGLQWLRDNWNVSVVRAAMGIEPDGAYLTDPEQAVGQLRRVVQNAIDLGLYVLIDWHDHHAELHRDESIAFFTSIAAEFGSFPNVLYEPYNEPLNIGWSSTIKPYHEAVLRAIRAEDPDNIVILGTRSWSQRVDEAARDRVAGDNLMYTVHFYACDHGANQRNIAQQAFAAGLPLFVTEWGATPADGGSANPIVCAGEAGLWHDWLDENRISWAAWKFDGCRASSCFFTSRQAPVNGPWTSDWLNGHAQFIIDRLRD